MLEVKFSDKGSFFRSTEEQVWIHFGDFLDECEGISYTLYLKSCLSRYFFVDGKTACDVNDVLVFFSGADSVPPLGFEKKPYVTFIHDNISKFCTASTYDLQLRLPTCHGEDYVAFAEAMTMSLKDNDGFGVV